MKFIHTADWQIGRVFGFSSSTDGHDASALLAKARLDVVESIAALARDEGVDAILVAGDVFDKQALSEDTLRRTYNAMAAFTGPWILLPGNHDAALAESVWTRSVRAGIVPSHVHLALDATPLLFDEVRFAILPAPLTQRHVHDDLTAYFDNEETPTGMVRIGLAHGSVAGVLPEAADSANPIAPDRAVAARLDYLALGDWHGTKQINARTWYSGTPEQDRFKDNDPGNVLLVEIDEAGALPRVTPRRVGQFRWHEANVDVHGLPDIEQLGEDLGSVGKEAVWRLQVGGVADFQATERLSVIVNEARARAHVLETDLSALRLEPTEADLASMQVDGALTAVVDELRERQAIPDQADAARESLRILFDILQRERTGAA